MTDIERDLDDTDLDSPHEQVKRLKGMVRGLAKRVEEAERKCPGCDSSLPKCWDSHFVGGFVKCCPDCEHRAALARQEPERKEGA